MPLTRRLRSRRGSPPSALSCPLHANFGVRITGERWRRTSFFYLATVITPAMVMRLTNIGSQYLGTFYDAQGSPLDGAKTYKVTLPPNIPAAKFWSFTPGAERSTGAASRRPLSAKGKFG